MLGSFLGLTSTIYGVKFLGDESFGHLLSLIATANIMCAFSMGGISQLSIKYLHSEKSIKKYNNLFIVALNQLLIITTIGLILYLLKFLRIEVIFLMVIFFILRLVSVLNKVHTKFVKSILFEGSTVTFAILITCISQMLFFPTNAILTFIIVLSAIVFFQLLDCAAYALPALNLQKKKNRAKDYYNSISLGFLGVITAIQNNIDVVLLNYLSENTEVTNYKLIMMLLLAFNMIHVVVNRIYGPKIALLVSEKCKNELNELWKISVIVQFLVGGVASIFLYIILVKFRDYTMFDVPVTFVGLIGIIVSCGSFAFRSFLHQVLIQFDLSSLVTRIYLQALIITLFTSPTFIIFYGYSGAILSYGVGQAICSILCFLNFKKQMIEVT